MPRICQDARFALTDWHGGVYTSWRMRVDLTLGRREPLTAARRPVRRLPQTSPVVEGGAMRNDSLYLPVAQAVTPYVLLGTSEMQRSTGKLFREKLFRSALSLFSVCCDRVRHSLWQNSTRDVHTAEVRRVFH